MRRFIAGFLFVTLLGQSSGASALAASTNAQPTFAAAFLALANPIHEAWLSSSLHAMLTGQLNRYEAMHAPRPDFPRVIRITTPPDASRRHEARIEVRRGEPAVVPGLHKPQAVDPGKAPRDPMAMRRSALATSLAPTSSLAAPSLTAPWHSRGSSMVANTLVHTMTTTPTPYPTSTPAPTPCPPGDLGTAPSCSATPTPNPTPTPMLPAPTGINHYWTYEEEPLPGIGKAMVNVGNGNMLVQVDDLDIPERGVDLAFRRTYNSESLHDANNTDVSTPSVFGNGWTNTFDAHLAYNSTYNTIEVYDIDGARYDFYANGQGQWTPWEGVGAVNYTTLTSDGACGYYWTKKTGTAYYFEAPNQPSTCTSQIPAGLAGRLLAIQGRNINNALTFTYSWANGNASNPEDLTQIVVSHSDGQSLTLTFGLLNGTGPDELQSISRPDGSTISYEYDGSGDLIEVDRPGNNTTSAQTCSSEHLLHS